MPARQWIRQGAAGIAAVFALASCQAEMGHLPGGEFDPTVRTRDPAILRSLLEAVAVPEQSRVSADRLLVEIKGAHDEGRMRVLEAVMGSAENSDAMRLYAMDQLAQADSDRAVHGLSVGLPSFEGAVLAHGCEWAARLGDKSLADALIRSLERELVDAKSANGLRTRPEWPALEKLDGQELREILFEKLEHSHVPAIRVAALDLLEALEPDGVLDSRLSKMNRADVWMDDLRWWMDSFGTAPNGPMEMQWVHYLRQPDQAAMVARAIERHRQLRGQKDYIAAPRFICVLANADEVAVSESREVLISDLKQRLNLLSHAHRVPEYMHARDDVDDTLDGQSKNLSRADLLAIHLLLKGLENRATIAQLERQGLEDLADADSEHGGLVTIPGTASDGISFILYPPFFAANNFEYLSSDTLLLETAKGIAQYHFHFQEVHNDARAGPGSGDLGYAQRTRCNCVVITSIGTGELNVDYYTPNGAVVDLGIYRTVEK